MKVASLLLLSFAMVGLVGCGDAPPKAASGGPVVAPAPVDSSNGKVSNKTGVGRLPGPGPKS